MATRPKLRASFVVTLSIAACVPIGCGGDSDADGSSSSGGSAGNSGTAGAGATGGGAGKGGAGGAGASGGSSGSAGNAGAGASGGSGGTAGGAAGSAGGGNAGSAGAGGSGCPASPPQNGAVPCTLTAGQKCAYTVDCQSGKQSFVYSCENNAWKIDPKFCEGKPYDSCPGTDLYCVPGVGWTVNQGTNPPAPCPSKVPQAGSQCFSGGFGGVHEKCGYPCNPVSKAGWLIATCPMAAGQQAVWDIDAPCD